MGGLLSGNPFLLACCGLRRWAGAEIIGGAPMVLYRRRAMPLIGGAVCNCLIGCALAFRHCEAWHKPWQSPFSFNYSLLTFPYFIGSIWMATAVRSPKRARRARSISFDISCEAKTVISPFTRICTSIAISEPIRRVRRLCGL